MRIVVTGSSGHLGEALMRVLRARGDEPLGVDIAPGAFTALVGSITDRAFVRQAVRNAEAVLHTATLHKPHIVTHSRQDFIDVNITGTLNLLEEAASAGVKAFVYTSTTSVFGDASTPPPGAPAVWLTEATTPIPKNIYGATKRAAEDLCQLAHRNQKLPVIVLRTSRFFLDADDDRAVRATYTDDNVKVNEYLYRRVDLEDAADACLLAMTQAGRIGFGRYIVSATSPFTPDDLAALGADPSAVARRRLPEFESVYNSLRWRLPSSIGRIYVNEKARRELGWAPRHDFRTIIARLKRGEDWRSDLARAVGSKLYHTTKFADGPYPVEPDGASRLT